MMNMAKNKPMRSSEQQYDVIVLGLGAMGSAAVYHLSHRGYRVLGLDAYPRGHTQGSSHGRSRIIREAYFESPEYVPLVQRAYTLWREMEAESATVLLTITGGLLVGDVDSRVICGARASAERHKLSCEFLSAADVESRFPGFRLTEDQVGVFEPHAGILDPEACVHAHLSIAAQYGAVMHDSEPVRQWSADGAGVRVETDRDVYASDRLIVAAGPWSGEILSSLDLPLHVERIVNVHFEPTAPKLFSPDRCPVSIWDIPEGEHYGFPALPGQGVKFGRHAGERCTPATIRREVDAVEIGALRAVLDRCMPGSAGAVKWTVTCMYTNTPDRNFVLDRHPEHAQVVYGCGFSGHGFKFASVIGEVLADLATSGIARHSIDFLSAQRFAPSRR